MKKMLKSYFKTKQNFETLQFCTQNLSSLYLLCPIWAYLEKMASYASDKNLTSRQKIQFKVFFYLSWTKLNFLKDC